MLQILLTPRGELHRNRDQYDPVAAAALQKRDPETGLTLLGQAVGWGIDEALPPVLDAVG